MTDNEIIKALNRNISNAKSIDCIVWSIEVYKLENALDLINRQKAEIERLQNALMGECMLSACSREKEIKSEAIQEFAERLKEKICCEDDCGYHCFDCCYECKDYVPVVDKLVKEMTEERKC